MNEQQRMDSLKRRYGHCEAPSVKAPRRELGHGPRHPMGQSGRGKPKNSRQTVKRLMGYLKEDRGKVLLAFACVIISTISTLAGSYMLRPIINLFIAPIDGSARQSRRSCKLLGNFGSGVWSRHLVSVCPGQGYAYGSPERASKNQIRAF